MTEDYEALLRIVRERRSIRRFQPTPVPLALIEKMLEAAQFAPSAANRQLYRFLVVTSPSMISEMGRCVREACEALTQRARANLAQDVKDYSANFLHFVGAPTVIVPIVRLSVNLAQAAMEPGTSPVSRGINEEIASISAAIMNLLLAAHALGLGTCWMTGPLVAADKLSSLLGVPHGWEMQSIIPVGYSDEAPKAPGRRPMSRIYRVL